MFLGEDLFSFYVKFIFNINLDEPGFSLYIDYLGS